MDKDTSETKREVPGSTRKKHHVVLLSLLGLLFAGLIGMVSLYTSATTEVTDLQDQVESLQVTIDSQRANNSNAAATPQPTAPTGGGPAPVVPQATTASCSGGSDYSASVGKFDLTLSDPNVTVRVLDGGFEGGPITSMTVGQCVSGENNVVEITPTGEVTILAHPSSTSADLKSSYEGQNGITLTAGSTTTVDGITAQIYTYSGLFSQKLLYFDNNSIGYQIELADDNTTSDAVLTDVVSDWSFTP